MSLNDREPMPTPNNHPAVWDLVLADMQERDRIGAVKYNTRLQPHNGRDFLVDAYQEAQDLTVYLRGKIEEEKHSLDLKNHIVRQREFSLKTFGPGTRTKGVLDHIRKELKEIEETPLCLEEWVDLVLLALDGAWRAGHSPLEICREITKKQEKNELRDWPDWRTSDPDKAIEHVRGNHD